MKYVLDIAYKGTRYHGWQVQKNAHSVQSELNNALSVLFKTPIETIGSGRTDTGVHAEQQFVQIESNVSDWDAAKLLFKLNAILPKDILIKDIYLASDQFNVRHDARLRSYEYRISRKRNPFLDNLCYFYYQRELDVSLMNEAAELLLNATDFQSFSKYHTDVAHFECTLNEARWVNQGDLLVFHISANRFLRGMVRAIVGTLLEIGIHKIKKADLAAILDLKDRKAAKHAVPPEGLFLTRVIYPDGMLTKLT